MSTKKQSEFYKKIGQNIRKHRLRSGITQELFAKSIGLSRTSVVNIEVGRQRFMVHALEEIASVLSTKAWRLLP